LREAPFAPAHNAAKCNCSMGGQRPMYSYSLERVSHRVRRRGAPGERTDCVLASAGGLPLR
jgi:hypothetical protein